jgi:hypothetical protein
MPDSNETAAMPWRTVEVRVPPEGPGIPGDWWVHTGTGECVNGDLRFPPPGSLPNRPPYTDLVDGAGR